MVSRRMLIMTSPITDASNRFTISRAPVRVRGGNISCEEYVPIRQLPSLWFSYGVPCNGQKPRSLRVQKQGLMDGGTSTHWTVDGHHQCSSAIHSSLRGLDA